MNNGCGSVQSTIQTVTVKVPPTVTIAAIQNVCGGTSAVINPTASVTNCAGATPAPTYLWSFPGGTPSTSTSQNPGPISYTTSGNYTVTLAVTNECGTATDTETFTVNPAPVMVSVPNHVKCKGQQTTPITFSSDLSGTTYTWTNTNTAIGLAATGNTANIPAFTTTNTTNAPITSTITVTPRYNGCDGAPQTFTITVNPVPAVNALSNITLCNAATQNAITLSSAVGGTTFDWTNSNPAIGLAANGTGNIPQFTASNTGTAPITATITVTPSANECNGNPVTFTITVNPSPAAMTLANADLCNGAPSPAIVFSNSVAGTTYTWTNSNTTIGLPASGTGNIPAFTPVNTGNSAVTATITVTPHSGSCNGSPQTFTITVSPSPVVQFSIANQTICSGETTAPVTLTSPTAVVNFSWTSAGATGITGTAISGTATIPAQTLINNTNAPITVQYSASGSLSGGAACPGSAFTYSITIKPKPAISNITIDSCSGSAFTVAPANGINGTVPDNTVYTWAAPAAQAGVTGLTAGNNSNSISATVTNSNTAPVDITYVVTPTTNGCTGSAFNITVTVQPTPTVTTVLSQTVCNGTNTAPINFTSPVGNTTFTWTNSNPSIGLAGNGTGNIAAFAAINNGNTAVTATITVTPKIGTCSGTPQNFTITVNPAPAVTFSQANQAVCSGAASSTVNLSSTTPGASISWTATQPAGVSGVTLSGTNSISAQTLTNSTTDPINVVYTATASTTGVSCPGATYSYTITVKPVPAITATLTATICSGGTFMISPQDGNGNSIPAGTQYTWTVPANGSITGESNQTTPQNNISQALVNTTNVPVTLTYTVTPITDGCNGNTFLVTVTVNPKPFIVAQNAAICSGQPFTISPANGGGNIVPATGVTYSWSAPLQDAGITGGQPGTDAASVSGTLTNSTNETLTATYTVTPNWTSGTETCTGEPFTIIVTVNPKPDINDMPMASCSGAPFTVTPANGTNGTVPANTTYTWAAPSPQAGVTGLVAGNNSNTISGAITNTNPTAVTVTYVVTPAANGCSGDTFEVTVTVAPTSSVATVGNQTVCNQSAITGITFTGTVTGTVFNWVNDTPSIGLAAIGSGDITSFTATNTGTTEITATITVTPQVNGCDGTPKTFTITVNPAPSVNFSQNDQTICSGTSSIVVNLTSATPNTSINWTANIPSGITGAAISGTTVIPAQTLVNTTNGVLTVTYIAVATTSDASACEGTTSTYTITVTPVPFVNNTELTSICSGSSPNYIPANTGGNNMPVGVTFTWTAPTGTGFTGGSAQNTPQPSLNQVLVNTTNLSVTANYIVTPHFGGCNGVPFTVQVTINPTATVPNATITLCSGSTFTFDPATVATILPANTVFNWGAPSGNVSGGAPGSAQSIVTGTLTNTTATVQAAVYTIAPVSPQGNCSGASFTLTVNVNPVFDVTSVVSNFNGFQISSAGANDGSIDLTPTGGTGTYTYTWTGPNGFAASTQDVSNLGPGAYTVVISDGLCENITLDFTLIEPMPLVIAEVTASHLNVNCFGQSTGVIEVAVTQTSVGPYDYTILLTDGTVVENVNNLAATNYVFDNLAAGTYNIRVTDANGTIKFLNGIQITQPATGLAITNAAVSNFNGFSISCKGANNGSIDLTVAGGYPGYTYSWTGTNGFTASTQDISGLAPGAYTVTVHDTTNACPVTQSFTITEPQVVAFTGAMSAFNGYQVSCFGGNNGTITITPSGGTGVYTYTWTGLNGFTASTQNLANLAVGTYTLTIADNNGCTAPSQSFTLTQPPALAITQSQVNVLCFGQATGSIDVTVSGGVPDNTGIYNYAWNGPNGFVSASEDLVNIAAGTYNLTASDENGCTIALSVTITEQPEIIIIPTTTPITCYGANNASIYLAITGGDPPYIAEWSNLATGTFQDNLAAGTYIITITDESNCQKPITVIIPEAPIFTVTPVVNNISCHGAHDGSIALNLVGGIAPVTLVWSDGSNQGTTRNNLGTGTYTATITDGTPCQIVRTFTIIEPATLNVAANLTHALDCNDAQTGAINLTVAGGTLPYTFAWSNGQTTEDLSGLTSGTYSVTVTDAGGCTLARTYTITRPDPIVLNVATDLAVNCNAHTVLQTNIAQASGGVPPFNYTWTSGNVSGPFGQYMNTDQNGTVIVTATDSSGCSATATFEVNTEQLGEADFTAGSYAFTTYREYSIFDPITFENLSTGDYTEVGWNFGDGSSSNEISPSHTYVKEGIYAVTLHVVYPYGCTDTYVMTIVVSKGYDVMVPNAFTPDGNGINDTFNPVHKGLKSIELNVYDTWGGMIYSEKGETLTGWNGTVKNIPAENGNFYFRIKAETFYGHIIELDGPFVLIK
ncbi:PKD-like domain-containing protein [uncultured Flavobacterium sp.]|uniref:PKD-like domain-containing protein n=1 Tax=uncultured Flavobacterium sp. TaxID=165435 RepID=UPI0025F546B3|nr:PKD-like domain-containing protein [uncultured Flavobacterium sp.]